MEQEQAMKIVAYYRVSTKSQGRSGLGLEGQQAAVEQYAKSNNGEIIVAYREVESGKKSDRPELMKAIAHARRSKATLCVAKIDRLSRNVAFLSALMESKVDFVACDMPSANTLVVHILIAVAQAEAKAISDRTKAALHAAKARGVKLGSSRPNHWRGREDRRLAGSRKGAIVASEIHRKSATDAYVDLNPVMQEQRKNGHTLQEIAAHLNSQGHTTRSGKGWNPTQVMRVLSRVS
jgi:DNA invertase Pin-like site-specific DNA recombinase